MSKDDLNIKDYMLTSNNMVPAESNSELESMRLGINFSSLSEAATNQANETVDNIIKFYFDLDKVNDNVKELIESKKQVDVISLQSIIYQLKTTDFAISQILEQLKFGVTNSSVRMLEALNAIQKTNIEATKTLTSMVNVLERQYKELKDSVETLILAESVEAEEDDKEGIHRGTKSLVKNLSNIDDEIEKLNAKPKD